MIVSHPLPLLDGCLHMAHLALDVLQRLGLHEGTSVFILNRLPQSVDVTGPPDPCPHAIISASCRHAVSVICLCSAPCCMLTIESLSRSAAPISVPLGSLRVTAALEGDLVVT